MRLGNDSRVGWLSNLCLPDKEARKYHRVSRPRPVSCHASPALYTETPACREPRISYPSSWHDEKRTNHTVESTQSIESSCLASAPLPCLHRQQGLSILRVLASAAPAHRPHDVIQHTVIVRRRSVATYRQYPGSVGVIFTPASIEIVDAPLRRFQGLTLCAG